MKIDERNKLILNSRLGMKEDKEICLDEDTFNKAIEECDLEIYTEEGLKKFKEDILKAQEINVLSISDIEKAKKDLSKLVKVTKIDKKGKKNTYWIKQGEHEDWKTDVFINQAGTGSSEDYNDAGLFEKEKAEELAKKFNGKVTDDPGGKYLVKIKKSKTNEAEKWAQKAGKKEDTSMSSIKEKVKDIFTDKTLTPKEKTQKVNELYAGKKRKKSIPKQFREDDDLKRKQGSVAVALELQRIQNQKKEKKI